jgi:hypothetical protein
MTNFPGIHQNDEVFVKEGKVEPRLNYTIINFKSYEEIK